jgi:hypothetical protein
MIINYEYEFFTCINKFYNNDYNKVIIIIKVYNLF